LRLILKVCFVQQSLAVFDAVYFRGLDEELSRQGIPEHLLPSARENIAKRILNTKNFGNTGDCFHGNVPSYPGAYPFPQDYLTSFLYHLFPRDEPFLLANQVKLDSVSKLNSGSIGQLLYCLSLSYPLWLTLPQSP
jgi:hypothetical protein